MAWNILRLFVYALALEDNPDESRCKHAIYRLPLYGQLTTPKYISTVISTSNTSQTIIWIHKFMNICNRDICTVRVSKRILKLANMVSIDVIEVCSARLTLNKKPSYRLISQYNEQAAKANHPRLQGSTDPWPSKLVRQISELAGNAHTESSVDRVASTMAAFFSCSYVQQLNENNHHFGCYTYLNDTAFDTIFYNELDCLYRPMLTETMNAVHGFCGHVRKKLQLERAFLRYST